MRKKKSDDVPGITWVEIRHICGKCRKVKRIERFRNGGTDEAHRPLTERVTTCRHCGYTFDYDNPPGNRNHNKQD